MQWSDVIQLFGLKKITPEATNLQEATGRWIPRASRCVGEDSGGDGRGE